MKHKLHSWLDAFRWRKLLLIWAVFLAMAAILFAERSGIRYASTQFKIDYLPRTEVKPASIAMFGQPVTCLLLYDSGQEGTDQVKEQFDQILLDMKVGTQAVDVHTTALTSLPEFSQYQTVVVLMSNLDALGKRLIDLMNWVQNGGSVLFAMTPDKTTYFDAISQKLGVQSSAWEYKMAESIVPSEDFMLGGGQRYEFSDPFQSAGRIPSCMPAPGTRASRWCGSIPAAPAGWWWITSASMIRCCGACTRPPTACCATPRPTPSSTGRCSTWTISPPRCRAAMAPISAGITA